MVKNFVAYPDTIFPFKRTKQLPLKEMMNYVKVAERHWKEIENISFH